MHGRLGTSPGTRNPVLVVPCAGAHGGRLTARFRRRQVFLQGALVPPLPHRLNLNGPGSAWWRRRELNPRPKQLPPGSLRACPRFWFSRGGSSRRDPLLPAAVTVLPQGRGAPAVAIRSM